MTIENLLHFLVAARCLDVSNKSRTEKEISAILYYVKFCVITHIPLLVVISTFLTRIMIPTCGGGYPLAKHFNSTVWPSTTTTERVELSDMIGGRRTISGTSAVTLSVNEIRTCDVTTHYELGENRFDSSKTKLGSLFSYYP